MKGRAAVPARIPSGVFAPAGTAMGRKAKDI